MMRDMQEFDRENAQALRAMWFLGDVHAEFRHIVTALIAAGKAGAGALPRWLVFLGDIEIDHKPFREILEQLKQHFPTVKVAFIYGNHDADTYEHWQCLHDCGDAVPLHGRVADLDGIKVAGIGGNFLGRIWAPPAEPLFRNKQKAINQGKFQWRDGQQPNPALNGAIYPDDVATLAKQRADILVTHEPPSCHHHGWEAFSQLARDLRVVRAFHGHTHDDLSDKYALVRNELGFDARAVNYCSIKNGLGEFVAGPPPGKEDWS
jgi:predicted MPP superfamily phosphohydrolase